MAEEEKKTHIEIHITTYGNELTKWYAVTPRLLADVQREIFDRARTPTAETLNEVLRVAGAPLDREDGPAFLLVKPTGYRHEEWYRDGRYHRENGPAYLLSDPNGERVQAWYCNGLRHREGGPAYVADGPSGTLKNGSKTIAQ